MQVVEQTGKTDRQTSQNGTYECQNKQLTGVSEEQVE
jgi:hypothetical protein